MESKLIQQGDVLFHQEKANVLTMKKVPSESGRLIFAKGEATGHHHSVAEDSGVDLWLDTAGTLWCVVTNSEGATVEHQEHNPVHLKKGTYRIGIVREVDPFSEEIRSVID